MLGIWAAIPPGCLAFCPLIKIQRVKVMNKPTRVNETYKEIKALACTAALGAGERSSFRSRCL